jgi:hypothetical protein
MKSAVLGMFRHVALARKGATRRHVPEDGFICLESFNVNAINYR